MKPRLAVFAVAGLLLAQTSSYNGGIPITPGTSVPESNPGTAIRAPSAPPPSSSPASTIGPPSTTSAAPSGPAYSFGAAPPPVVGPGR